MPARSFVFHRYFAVFVVRSEESRGCTSGGNEQPEIVSAAHHHVLNVHQTYYH